MAVRTVEKEIDGQGYVTRTFGALRGGELFLELVGVFGYGIIQAAALGADGLAEATKFLTGSKDADGSGTASLKDAATAILDKLTTDPTKTMRMIVRALGQTQVATGVGTEKATWLELGTEKAFDDHFGDRLPQLFEVFVWVLQENFRPFFSGNTSMGVLFRGFLDKQAAPTSANSASTSPQG